MTTESKSAAVAMNRAGVRDPRIDGPQGDAIPFFHKGRYHLYYLEAPAGKLDQPERGRTPWRHVVSDDLVHWEDLGIMLPLGSGDGPDVDGIWTGSVIVADGLVHIFYTGGNRSRETPQTICHATSRDGVTFVKDAANPLFGPDQRWFEARDWRDPYVFWNAAHNQFWMLLSGRVKEGPPGRRGVVVLSTSSNLAEWSVRQEPFYAPGNTYCMECPELFELGGRWRLLFSRFSEQAATIYRDGDSPEGPWRTPSHPALDGARWYAAKSLTDDRGRRIAFGWVHDRRGFSDKGEWLWGGDMCLPREIYPQGDRLFVRVPLEIDDWLNDERELNILPAEGRWLGGQAAAVGSFASAALEMPGTSPELRRLTIIASLENVRGGIGLALHADHSLTRGVAVFFEAGSGRVTLSDIVTGREADRSPEPMVTNWVAPRLTGEVQIDVYLRGNILEVFVDRQVALTHRSYSSDPLNPIVYVEDGIAGISARLSVHRETVA